MIDYEYAPRPNVEELPLFSRPFETKRSEQQTQLRRVTGNIADLILEFFEGYQVGEMFHAGDLHKFVSNRASVSPASSDRVMRQLRLAGQVHYEVVNRAASLYRKVARKDVWNQ